MSWIRDLKNDFGDTTLTKAFFFIGLAVIIFAPGVAYWSSREDIKDVDRFIATEFKDETVARIYDLPARGTKGLRQVFTITSDEFHNYPIYLKNSDHETQIKAGAHISKAINSREFTVTTEDGMFTFQLSDMRSRRAFDMLIYFALAFGWSSIMVVSSYNHERKGLRKKN